MRYRGKEDCAEVKNRIPVIFIRRIFQPFLSFFRIFIKSVIKVKYDNTKKFDFIPMFLNLKENVHYTVYIKKEFCTTSQF